MRWTGPAAGGAFCVALVAFTLNVRSGAVPDSPELAASSEVPSRSRPAPADASPGDGEGAPPSGAITSDRSVVPGDSSGARADVVGAAPAPVAPPSSDRSTPSVDRDEDREDERRRRRRGWRRNRYPGPIPTPEEWEPPDGPVRIGLQVGHWRTEEAPPELDDLRNGGTRWRGTPEWQVNLEIARRATALLEQEGYAVDLLPAVVPPSYRAHLFISIHADGSNDPNATGYRIAAPRWDATGRASQVVELLERTYGEATGLSLLPTVTRRMRAYYAFNFRRYEHALHPMTIAVILETGFLTSARDRRVIVDTPERAARGIVDAVKAFSVTRLQREGKGAG